MGQPLVECVPNISEGRNIEVITILAREIERGTKARVLNVDSCIDSNRTVITFAGEPESVLLGAFQLVQKAVELIDMRIHKGEHPRMGAVDVCPFVPLRNTSLDLCTELSNKLGARVGDELSIPVYLYEQAASDPERRSLYAIRKGEFEGLKIKAASSKWVPDFGPHEVHSTFGALITGSRPFLIAYNVSLSTKDVSIASRIASRIRQNSKCGVFYDDEDIRVSKLSGVKALGWFMEAFGVSQVSTNICTYRACGMAEVYNACCYWAKQTGVEIVGSELVGLVPREAMVLAGRWFKSKSRVSSVHREEGDEVSAAIDCLKLDCHKPFSVKEQCLESRLEVFGM